MTAATTASSVRQVYRDMARLIRHRPEQMNELRQKFRQKDPRPLDDRLKEATSRLAVLRMTSVKARPTGQAGRFVFRNGQKVEISQSKLRDGQSHRVHSNWDGKNMDPESVKRHYQGLKRAGFVNNLHAKGMF